MINFLISWKWPFLGLLKWPKTRKPLKILIPSVRCTIVLWVWTMEHCVWHPDCKRSWKRESKTSDQQKFIQSLHPTYYIRKCTCRTLLPIEEDIKPHWKLNALLILKKQRKVRISLFYVQMDFVTAVGSNTGWLIKCTNTCSISELTILAIHLLVFPPWNT